MYCKRCGTYLAEPNNYCPHCGAVNVRAAANANAQPHTDHTPYTSQPTTGNNTYQQQGNKQSEQASYQYGGKHNNPNSFVPPTGHAYYQQTPNIIVTNKNSRALIIEFILSLLGLFGIGWLMARKTTIGIILLVCSICLYWPFMIFGTIVTFGFGLICLGPLAIGTIILNILLLNYTLNKQATRFFVSPQQPPYTPPTPPYN
ncbi:MAG TPA: hypothetical protein VL461_08090 [Dictyobacter sp.]|jgi:hypothetical protein|nr:hypothetical protein [Dictyobacter sp.]